MAEMFRSHKGSGGGPRGLGVKWGAIPFLSIVGYWPLFTPTSPQINHSLASWHECQSYIVGQIFIFTNGLKSESDYFIVIMHCTT